MLNVVALKSPIKQLVLAAGLALAVGAAQATPKPPDQIVRDTTEQMRKLISANHELYRKDKAAFYKVVDDVLVPRFDVRYIAQLVLGKNWRAASPGQRDRFTEAFKTMLIRGYAETLLEYYDSVEAEWQPLRTTPEIADVTVRTKLMVKDRPPLPIGFSMRLVGEEWKVYDITVEAISLVTNFRSQINSEIKRTSLDDVIARMEKGEAFKPQTSAGSASTGK